MAGSPVSSDGEPNRRPDALRIRFLWLMSEAATVVCLGGSLARPSRSLHWPQLLAHRDPPFVTEKVVGLISTAGGVQGLQAANTMDYVVRALRGWAVPLVVPIAARQAFDEQSELTDARVEDQLRGLGREVVEVCLRRKP